MRYRTDRGITSSKAQRAEIEAAIDDLASFAPEITTSDRLLSGTWRLVWTSERETRFLMEKGLAFVGPTGDVLQARQPVLSPAVSRVVFAAIS